jgi:predicted alpha/beta-hydrolase family hydrolase
MFQESARCRFMTTASMQTIRLVVSDGVSVTAKVDAPRQITPSTPGLVLAHGANNNLDHPLLASVALRVAREAATLVLRFNFPYAERGATSPDSRAVLEQTYRRAYELLVGTLLAPGAPVFLGGKSLGGRFAAEFVTGTAASGTLPASGLVILGYPAHAPGRRDKTNFRPLQNMPVPSLIFVGTRDPFCSPEEIAPVLAGLPVPGRLVVVEGADHSFHLPASSGKTADHAYETIGAETAAFIHQVSAGALASDTPATPHRDTPATTQ